MITITSDNAYYIYKGQFKKWEMLVPTTKTTIGIYKIKYKIKVSQIKLNAKELLFVLFYYPIITAIA